MVLLFTPKLGLFVEQISNTGYWDMVLLYIPELGLLVYQIPFVQFWFHWNR